MSIKISSQFDAGAIEVVNATSANAIDLNIRKDSHADIVQWFYFRLQGAQGQACTIRFLNAAQAAYPAGWEGYQAMASYDRVNWFRVPTSYDGKVMTIEHTPGMDSVYYAYFEPYSWERHLELLDRAQMAENVRMLDLGSTVDGRDLNMLVIGEPSPEKKKVWVIARQHPGETMAEWFVEGMLDALLDPAHPFGRQLLKESVFYVVPNMNPDGSVRGNLRTNAAGANLNREWMNPSMERSPEVFLVLKKMHETGVDLCLDVHGDEGLPYVFVAGSESLPTWTEAQAAQQQRFIEDFKIASPDFQDVHGYGKTPFTDETLTMGSSHITHAFGCLSLTLELPFKDNANDPDPQVGWDGARSARLGAAVLQPVLNAVRALGAK
ncbi:MULTISPECIES: M14 family metallopeptidase [Massilia]|uniref:M14 family metallopeptidase n=1 Tax=Massilia TaxID=149698 RepID=UPI0004E342BE|nr:MULTISPECIES: M14-type cytosolic carboxypeptidase [Massilia]KFC67775.1 Peptidase M14 carboxypeptidase A [Massilia sp. LC238]MDK6075625.1 M14-type cytosolic carboxypeptidase [Massilia varians]